MAQEFVSTQRAIAGILEHVRAGQTDAAVTAYTRYQEDIGYPLLSKVAGDKGMQKALANLFFRARDYPKAAMCCENLGEYEKAAMLYEKCQSYDMAAEMYAHLEKPVRAAEMFEKAQKHRQAAELFMQAGEAQRAAVNYEKALSHFHAGKLYFELDRTQKSMELLQKVKREEDEFVDAALLIANILDRNGHTDLALRKLQGVVTGDIDSRGAKILYKSAELYAKKGQKAEAEKLLTDIVAWDFNYPGAHARLQDLQRGGKGYDENAQDLPVIEDAVPEVTQEEASGAAAVVSVMDGFEYLKQLPLFEELSLQEMKALYTRCEQRTFAPGDVLIKFAVTGENLFILTRGEFDVRVYPSGAPLTVATLGAGKYVGEMSLIDDAPTSAEVLAKTSGTALVISKQNFHSFLSSNDYVALRIYKVFVRTMCERLRKANEQMKKS